MLLIFADAASLWPARMQMAFTLGFHIVLACFGVGFPILLLAAEWRHLRSGDEIYRVLARRWSKAFAVLFAIGAVSGTVLSFELGLLWPEFMGTFGAVIGLPFTMEGFAFFLEAIFVGIYLYGWERLSPRLHWWTGVPIALAGFMSAAFVVTANAWMNCPRGFRMDGDTVTDVDPLAAMWNPASPAQIVHMILAAYMVTGFCVAAFYASLLLRNGSDNKVSSQAGATRAYAARAMAMGLWLAVIATPLQMAVGDWSAKVVAKTQPVKFAAMEGQYVTERGAPLRIGGWPDDEDEVTRYAIELPGLLSWIAYGQWDAEVAGLRDVPRADRPPVHVVHLAFQLMVGVGTGCMALVVWAVVGRWRNGRFPVSRGFLACTTLSGPAAILAMEAGWTVTEVGRQPWIVHGVMRTEAAVTHASGVWYVFFGTLAIYAVLGIATIVVLRLLSAVPLPELAETPAADLPDGSSRTDNQ